MISAGELRAAPSEKLLGARRRMELRGSSKTLILGDAPVVSALFNSRSSTERQDVALVLVPPRLAGSIETGSRAFRGEALNRLLSLWKNIIDPRSDLDAILGTIEKCGVLSRLRSARACDLRLPPVSDPSTIRTVVNETMIALN